eukprot:CAMPEP_0168610478 /NCGR_PEP_ID=MMETSP0449_2-20121227/1809_1 /TAXON_ID=1082188 /ORGANISM="Strombidium rassoulzadegani, Strain ras09" /LENGTH=57 /DNA_ID=CAMNT_0008650787 /DNA_START=698 /DNA_END=871 /DNA_ORIENTATION=+
MTEKNWKRFKLDDKKNFIQLDDTAMDHFNKYTFSQFEGKDCKGMSIQFISSWIEISY